MCTGANQVLQQQLPYEAFLRTNIEIIDRFFGEDEVQEIWLTFSDPQMKNARKRLTSTYFLQRYRHFLNNKGLVHLKTDSNFLFTYTKEMALHNGLTPEVCTEDLYNESQLDEATMNILNIRTYYESMWLERGLNIRYMKFRLPKDGELSEPEVEIEFDNYRSYHRPGR